MQNQSTTLDQITEKLSPIMQQALQAENLTFLALEDALLLAIERSFAEGNVYEKIARSLFRSEAKHVVLIGDKGVGKSAVLRELVRRAAAGRYPFLADKQFLRLDCSAVPLEDGRAVLERIVREVGDWENLILCLDGMGPLLKRSADSVAFLRAVLMRSGLQMIGTLTRWEYQDLLGGDAGLSDLITRIEIDEPSDEEALAILESKREELEREHQVRLDEDVPRRTVALASAYVLRERHPAKALKLLRRACENVSFARTQRGSKDARVRAEDVIEAASELTGVPLETLSGDGGTADYEAALTASVVGQPDAVKTVATELKLIKAGLTEPDRPASVLLFAGMTGVGKTELAKALARLYSATGRLQVYSMGNFTEPHTVSGIIGVPPGYVGHDQGGRLVNELNSDPYAVFLLDEAEKAHPNVWKPFLNLFDEGWIVDQRGIKAHADRAIFILTTNAGDQQIAQMSQQGKNEEEIISRVKQTLSKIRHERSTQPVFAPQFLARLQRILIFRPLDEAAMIGIARIQVEKMQTTWKRKREKTLIVPETLVQHVGQLGHQVNQDAKGQEGGRIIRKLLVDTIECPIQKAVTERAAEYKSCSRIELVIDDCEPMEEATIAEKKMNLVVQFLP